MVFYKKTQISNAMMEIKTIKMIVKMTALYRFVEMELFGINRMETSNAMIVILRVLIAVQKSAKMQNVEMGITGTLTEELSNATMEMMTTAIHAWIRVRLQIA